MEIMTADQAKMGTTDIEKKIDDAVKSQMARIQHAIQEGECEALWIVSDDLDFQLRKMFREKGYGFKHVPYRPGFWGHGDWVTW